MGICQFRSITRGELGEQDARLLVREDSTQPRQILRTAIPRGTEHHERFLFDVVNSKSSSRLFQGCRNCTVLIAGTNDRLGAKSSSLNLRPVFSGFFTGFTQRSQPLFLALLSGTQKNVNAYSNVHSVDFSGKSVVGRSSKQSISLT